MDDHLHILIVEDDPLDAAHLREQLDGLTIFTFKYHMADRLEDAVDILSVSCPDLVFLDLRLPDGTGSEVIASIRRVNSDVPVVVVTGIEPPDYQELALVQDVVHKPFADKMALILALGYGVKFHMQTMA